MILSQIFLYNFRSYKERQFEFSPSVNIIVGPNGVGKTNLLEAVYVLFQGKSFRDNDEALVNYLEDWWRLVGQIDDDQREVRFEKRPNSQKQLVVNSSEKKRFTYRQQLPVVLFEPDDLLMVHDSPSARRYYIDNLLVKIDPSYNTTLKRYERALLQRNNLLKRSYRYCDSLKDAVFVWDVALAEYGSKIMEKRQKIVEVINQTLSEEYSRIADKKQDLRVVYLPSVSSTAPDSTAIVQLLANKLPLDVERGITTAGPHRDDFGFVLNKQPAKQTASRGEVRTIVLALKQIELDLVERYNKTSPVFLLDDVFSELDKHRQKSVFKKDKGQYIITSHTKGAIEGANILDIYETPDVLKG